MDDLRKVFVFGSSGYIGSSIYGKLKELGFPVFSVGRGEQCDVSIDLSSVGDDDLSAFSTGDCVVFLAANSSPELCAKNYDDAYAINVVNTSIVIENLLAKGVYVLFASSDAVYGRTNSAVNELDKATPQFEYAQMKFTVENKFEGNDHFKVMRLSYVWSDGDKFTKYLLNSSAENNVVEVFDPFIRSIISLEDVVGFVHKFVVNPKELPGVVNLAGPQYVSRVQLVKEISKYIPIMYKSVTPDDDFFKYRPDQILMESLYLKDVLGREPSSISQAMKASFGK